MLLLRLLEVHHLLLFTPASLAAGDVTPLTFLFPLLMGVISETTRENTKQDMSCSGKSPTLFSQLKRQSQAAAFKINQKAALSMGAMC